MPGLIEQLLIAPLKPLLGPLVLLHALCLTADFIALASCLIAVWFVPMEATEEELALLKSDVAALRLGDANATSSYATEALSLQPEQAALALLTALTLGLLAVDLTPFLL